MPEADTACGEQSQYENQDLLTPKCSAPLNHYLFWSLNPLPGPEMFIPQMPKAPAHALVHQSARRS